MLFKGRVSRRLHGTTLDGLTHMYSRVRKNSIFSPFRVCRRARFSAAKRINRAAECISGAAEDVYKYILNAAERNFKTTLRHIFIIYCAIIAAKRKLRAGNLTLTCISSIYIGRTDVRKDVILVLYRMFGRNICCHKIVIN